MAYRNRITTSDPRLQVAARNAAKGNSAIQGASAAERGLYSSFAGQEGSRLAQGELAGNRLTNAEKNLETQRGFNRQALANQRRAADIGEMYRQGKLGIARKDLSMEKDRFDDAKLGSWIGLGLGAADTGYNLYSGYKDSKARANQNKQTEAMKQEWVRRNPTQAYEYERRYPGVFGIASYLPRPGYNTLGTSSR